MFEQTRQIKQEFREGSPVPTIFTRKQKLTDCLNNDGETGFAEIFARYFIQSNALGLYSAKTKNIVSMKLRFT